MGLATPARVPRRLAVAATAAAIVFAAVVPSAALARDRDEASLRHESGSLLIGTAVNVDALNSDAQYRDILPEQFDSVTAENVMKWDTTEPAPGVFNFGPADELVQFAEQHGMKVRGHTFVWHNQLPAWVTSGNWTADQLRAILKRHIQTEAAHFRGKVYAWDVVNEIFDDSNPPQLRNTFWLQNLGPSYIADAFRWAHEAAPDAKLYANDYNVEGINGKSTAYLNLLTQLRAEGVPVSGFGIQGHLDIQYGFPTSMQQNIQRFVAAGFQVSVTEADVRMTLPVTPEKLATQASYYHQMIEACNDTKGCAGFTVWGFTDKFSWVPSVFAGEGAADIYDENYNTKPAYWALFQELAERGSRYSH